MKFKLERVLVIQSSFHNYATMSRNRVCQTYAVYLLMMRSLITALLHQGAPRKHFDMSRRLIKFWNMTSLATFAASHVSACSTQTTSLTEVLHSNFNNKFSGLSQKKQAKARLAAAILRWSCPLSYSFRWRAERDEDIYIFFIYQQMWFTCKVTLCFLCRSCPRTSHHEYVWYLWVDLRLRCEHVQVLRGRRVDTTFPLIWWLLMWRIHMKSLRREDVPGHLSGFWPTSHRNNW